MLLDVYDRNLNNSRNLKRIILVWTTVLNKIISHYLNIYHKASQETHKDLKKFRKRVVERELVLILLTD